MYISGTAIAMGLFIWFICQSEKEHGSGGIPFLIWLFCVFFFPWVAAIWAVIWIGYKVVMGIPTVVKEICTPAPVVAKPEPEGDNPLWLVAFWAVLLGIFWLIFAK